MKYTRIYSDANGESHFSEESIELSSVQIAPPAAPVDIATPIPTKNISFASLPTKWYGEPHPAPANIFWILLSGSYKVTTSLGEERIFEPGSILLAEDTTGKGHTTEVVSESPAIFAFTEKA